MAKEIRNIKVLEIKQNIINHFSFNIRLQLIHTQDIIIMLVFFICSDKIITKKKTILGHAYVVYTQCNNETVGYDFVISIFI